MRRPTIAVQGIFSSEEGYEVRDYASGGSVAFDRLEGVEVLLTDLPVGQDGLEFAKRFHAAVPSVPVVIIITASATDHLEREVAPLAHLTLLYKPFDYEQLLGVLHNLNCHPQSAA